MVVWKYGRQYWNKDNTGYYTHDLIPEVNRKIIFPNTRDVGVSYCRSLLHDTFWMMAVSELEYRVHFYAAVVKARKQWNIYFYCISSNTSRASNISRGHIHWVWQVWTVSTSVVYVRHEAISIWLPYFRLPIWTYHWPFNICAYCLREIHILLPPVSHNVDVLIQARPGIQPGLEYRPGVWCSCANRGWGLLLEEIRYVAISMMMQDVWWWIRWMILLCPQSSHSREHCKVDFTESLLIAPSNGCGGISIRKDRWIKQSLFEFFASMDRRI